jgi:hypothetical protein
MKNKKFVALLVVLFAALSATIYFSYGKKQRTLLVVGCARSGTTYISKVLKKSGLRIGHEKMSRDGISTCELVGDPKRGYWQGRWGVIPENYDFAHIFHQVRNPLNVISSTYVTENLNSWYFIMNYIPEILMQDSHLVKCAKYWYYWNLKAEKIAEWTYRIEDLDQKWEEFEKRLGRKISRAAIENTPRNINSRKTYTRQFTWEDLQKELDPTLYQNIRELAKRYGYYE